MSPFAVSVKLLFAFSDRSSSTSLPLPASGRWNSARDWPDGAHVGWIAAPSNRTSTASISPSLKKPVGSSQKKSLPTKGGAEVGAPSSQPFAEGTKARHGQWL